MRNEGYGSRRVGVCLSLKSHLTFGASDRPENAVTYNNQRATEVEIFVGISLKLFRFKDTVFPALYGYRANGNFFTMRNTRVRF